MSQTHDSREAHAFWRGAYRAVMVILPNALRAKHGEAMQELFARELERRRESGEGAVWQTAMSGLYDVMRRGMYERVIEERAALTRPNLQAMRSVAAAYAVALVVMTGALVGQYVWRHPLPNDRQIAAAALYAIPFTAALTIPMAVFVAVLWGSTRNSADGIAPTHDAARTRGQLRMLPLLAMAAVVALLAFGWNAEVVPRANARLAALLTGRDNMPHGDRSMTLGELRVRSKELAQHTGAQPTWEQRRQLVSTDVEIHKKPAIAGACLVFALLAAALARRAPRAGVGVQTLVAVGVFASYYVILMAGESLADQQLVWPALAMWSANAVLLCVAAMIMRSRGRNAARHLRAPIA